MKKNLPFWVERFQKLGHTGWQNPVIYAYDQRERLELISQKIAQLEKKPIVALDFGCGSGDFSQLLLKKKIQVYGYDPFTEPHINHPNFIFLSDKTKLENVENEFDLILSVTVLDHILEDKAFEQTLKAFRQQISENGYLILIEYALDNPPDVKNEYQSFRTIYECCGCLSKCGWDVLSIEPVPHPLEAPSTGFLNYRKNPIVFLIEKLLRVFSMRSWIQSRLNHFATQTFLQYGVGTVANSPLKLICCQPKS